MSKVALFSSGSNAHGQLSNESLEDSHEFMPCTFYGCQPRTMPPQAHQVIDVVSGANHTIVLLETFDNSGELQTELWGCGDGTAGQLGAAYRQTIRSGVPSTILRPIDLSLNQEGLEGYYTKFVSASWETTYIALSCLGKGDVLISMGADDFGDLGIGNLKSQEEVTKPFHIVSFSHITVDGMSLEAGKIIIQSLNSGQHHVVTRLQVTQDDGHTRTCTVGWGASRHGQVGSMTTKSGKPFSYISKPTLIPMDDSYDPIVSTALGSQHTVFLHTSGAVSAFGSNRKGQLQGIERAQHVTKLDCTWNGTYLLLQKDDMVGHVLATGSHMHGQLGRKPDNTNLVNSTNIPALAPVELALSPSSGFVTDMACGTEHVLALVSIDGMISVWGWGWNEHGNLGTGEKDDVFIPVKIWPPESRGGTQHSYKAVKIWAGSGTSWICSTTC